MEFEEVLKRRRMVRAYRRDPVDPAAVKRIVRTIRRAPSAGFSQGQRLVVVTDPETRARIAAIRGEEWLADAPVHILLLLREADYHARYQQADKLDEQGREIEWPVPYWYVDAGAMMMLLLLAAIDEGLAGCFIGALSAEGTEIKRLLAVPDDLTLVGLVTVGRPAGDDDGVVSSRLTQMRKPLEELVRRERWT